MPDRSAEISEFLAKSGWQNAQRTPLANDASPRQYQRLKAGDGQRAILMDAPPSAMSITPFLNIARHLSKLGFSAPEIIADDEISGLALIEDFGDHTFNRVLKDDPARETELYSLAVDILAAVHKLPTEQVCAPTIPLYSEDILLEEVSRFSLWYMPTIAKPTGVTGVDQDFQRLWAETLKPVYNQPKTLVFRDFHIDNLMILEGRTNLKRCGLLDFQDAVIGAGAYDLVSLLEDARRDCDDDLVKSMYNRYLSTMNFSGQQREDFDTAYAILGTQRHTKVIGLFVRLCVRDGKPLYLPHIPRVWRLLERNLCHPALSSLKIWFDTNLPIDKRGIPPHLAE